MQLRQRAKFYHLYSLLLFISLMAIELFPAPQQKTIQEEVTVVAVEVPIRVLQKGQTIKNLTK